MRQFVVDQLRADDVERLREWLNKNHQCSSVEDLWWIEIPDEYLDAIQKSHKACQPYYFSINLRHDKILFELLIRTNNINRCSCIKYADRKQLDYILDKAEQILYETNTLV